MESAFDAWLVGRLQALGVHPDRSGAPAFFDEVTGALTEAIVRAQSRTHIPPLGARGRPWVDPAVLRELEAAGSTR